jgi:ribonuclease D
VAAARALPDDALPLSAVPSDGPPPPNRWADRDPDAAARLVAARAALADLSARLSIPVENLLTPDILRRVLWTPPHTRDPGELLDEVTSLLSAYGARGWQIALTAPLLTHAILDADNPAEG